MGWIVAAGATAVIVLWLMWCRLSGPGGRPKFKDFRYSGSTYEESHDNYQRALERWQQKTGRE
jgi:hypothetical protein